MSISLKEKDVKKNCLSIKVLFSHGNGDNTSSRETNVEIPVNRKDLIEKIMKETFSFIKDIERKVSLGVDIDDMDLNIDIDKCNRDIAFFDVEGINVMIGLDTDNYSSYLCYAKPYYALFEYFDEDGKCFTVKL